MGSGAATRKAIREYVEEQGSATGPELAAHLGITPQAVSLHIRAMVRHSAGRKDTKT